MGLFDLLKRGDIHRGVEEFLASPNGVLLDVRSRSEYAEGHIPGSVNLDVAFIGNAPQKLKDKAAPLFVYCYSGARSGQAVAALKKMGYENVQNIGGIAAYRGKIER